MSFIKKFISQNLPAIWAGGGLVTNVSDQKGDRA